MKQTVAVARIIVGLLFIFSGLVKANDPLGLSYKMQEFFEIWGFAKFNSWTLLMSVLMNAFEIIAGFALLLGWRIKLFSWLLLLLIVFFTFLTGYTYITGKPTNCGCFGDCLPITSKTSFLKDVVLTILIGFLFWKQKYIRPLFGEKAKTLSMLGITILSFGFQWYTLNYLPVVDCLPFKVGKNINEQMKMPADAIPDQTEIIFNYIKDGIVLKFPEDSIPAAFNKGEYVEAKDQEDNSIEGVSRKLKVYVKGGTMVEIVGTNFPADFSSEKYTLIKRNDKLVKKGKNNQPPISGFVLTGITGEDSTQIILSQPYAILLFSEDFSIPVSKWEKGFSKIYEEAKAKNIPAYLVTIQQREAIKKLKNTSFANIQVFSCDRTPIRSAARTNPSIYLLKEGSIIGKWSWKKMSSVQSEVNKL
jgi:uncharacterized membrane protein YphA (DoxX/SURF4 family)